MGPEEEEEDEVEEGALLVRPATAPPSQELDRACCAFRGRINKGWGVGDEKRNGF